VQSSGSHTVQTVVVSNNQSMSRTILIVDDHPDFRASVRRLLLDAGYEVVGEASDGASALAAARELRPAIVLLDVQLPDLDGFDVALHLTRDADPPAVVLTSIHDRDDLAGMIAHSGARGFLPKAELSAPALAEILT
jgi:DNA-binding NarL/FixJ family response regulator